MTTSNTLHTIASLKALMAKAPKGSTFHIGAGSKLIVVEEDGESSGNYLPSYAIVPVSKPAAITFAEDSLRHFESRNARINVYARTNNYSTGIYYVIG